MQEALGFILCTTRREGEAERELSKGCERAIIRAVGVCAVQLGGYGVSSPKRPPSVWSGGIGDAGSESRGLLFSSPQRMFGNGRMHF